MLCAWLHHITSRCLELHRLEMAARTHERPELPVLDWISSSEAVWRLSVPGQEPRFMSVSSGLINQDFFIVHLDAERFYRTWLKASPARVAMSFKVMAGGVFMAAVPVFRTVMQPVAHVKRFSCLRVRKPPAIGIACRNGAWGT